MSGVIGGAEMVLIPEVDTPLEDVAETIAEAYARGKTHAIVIVAEGARFNATAVAEYLDQNAAALQTRVT
ncbi:MAG: 6-phosphofructokinase, partial [Chloroflexota bacterium]